MQREKVEVARGTIFAAGGPKIDEEFARVEVPAEMKGPAMTSQLPTEDRDRLEKHYLALRDRLHTPEALGRALVDVILSEAAKQGTLNGNRLEIPATLSVSLPPASPSSEDTGVISTICHDICIDVFGHQIFCIHNCHDTIISTSP